MDGISARCSALALEPVSICGNQVVSMPCMELWRGWYSLCDPPRLMSAIDRKNGEQQEATRMHMRFRDRRAAGQALAASLTAYADQADVIVLALPRGGVPVGYEVAMALHLPLDVFLVRKLGVPGHEELAMGAIASGGAMVLNHDVIADMAISEQTLDLVAAAEDAELARREWAYRNGRPALHVAGQGVILVDDGLATGATMRVALISLRQEQPRHLIAAVPVAPAPTCDLLRSLADEVVCLATPEPFYGVGLWYDDFAPTSDGEVRDLLALASERFSSDHHREQPPEPFAPD